MKYISILLSFFLMVIEKHVNSDKSLSLVKVLSLNQQLIWGRTRGWTAYPNELFEYLTVSLYIGPLYCF